MQSGHLDAFGNPVGTGYGGDGECPEQYAVCYTPNEFEEFLQASDLEYNTKEQILEPKGDAEVVLDWTTQLLFLDWTTLLYLVIPLSIFAVYGLTIYAGVKFIQKKFS